MAQGLSEETQGHPSGSRHQGQALQNIMLHWQHPLPHACAGGGGGGGGGGGYCIRDERLALSSSAKYSSQSAADSVSPNDTSLGRHGCSTAL